MLRLKVNYLNYHESKKNLYGLPQQNCVNKLQSAVPSVCFPEHNAQLFTPYDVTPRRANHETHRHEMNLKRQIAALRLVLPAHRVLSLDTGCPEI